MKTEAAERLQEGEVKRGRVREKERERERVDKGRSLGREEGRQTQDMVISSCI